MATDATGTPSANRSYPKYLTSADAPSGVGLNNIIDAIDADIQDIVDNTPTINGSPVEGDALVYDTGTGTWRPSSVQTMAVGGLAAGTDGQVLLTNGSSVEWGDAETDVRYRSTSTVTVTNTTTETALISQEIGAGVMGTDKVLRLTALGELQLGGVNEQPRVRVKLGAATIMDTGAAGNGNAADGAPVPWFTELWLQNMGATNSQRGYLRLVRSSTGWNATETLPIRTIGTSAVDTTSAQTLEITVQWAAASTSRIARVFSFVIEIV